MRKGQGIQRRKKSGINFFLNYMNHCFRELKPKKFATGELNRSGIHSIYKTGIY